MPAGRKEEIRKLIDALRTPGKHVLLYGDQGVGKSSLANVVTHTAGLAATLPCYRKRCDHKDTFESIFRKPLVDAGVDVRLVEYTTQHTTIGKRTLAAFDLGLEREQQSGLASTYRPGAVVGAADAAEHLAGLPGFMLIDEFDAISDPVTRRKVAELIKHLSDARSSFKIMLVGTADTVADLTGADPRLRLPLQETKLSRMLPDGLCRIVRQGAEALGLTFEEDVITEIARLSAGYPHVTHLLALKCAESAIRNRQDTIDLSALPQATAIAADDAPESLRHSYSRSIGSHSDSAVLTAAAALDVDEFTNAHLHASTDTDPSEPLRRLASTDGTTILRQTAGGLYRFSDPRMRSYIRISTHT